MLLKSFIKFWLRIKVNNLGCKQEHESAVLWVGWLALGFYLYYRSNLIEVFYNFFILLASSKLFFILLDSVIYTHTLMDAKELS